MNLFKNEKNALVISAGSVKGIIMLGSLEYIEKLNIQFSVYCGSSVGSIICFTKILGYKPSELIAKLCSFPLLKNMQSYFNYFNLIRIQNGGIIPFEIIEEFMIKLMTEKNIKRTITLKEFYELYPYDYYITSFNITQNQKCYLSHKTHPNLQLLKALQMSCSIPFIFEPCIMDNDIYIDGAFTEHFPINFISNLYSDYNIVGITVKTKDDEYLPYNLIPNNWNGLINVLKTFVKYYNKNYSNSLLNVGITKNKNIIICCLPVLSLNVFDYFLTYTNIHKLFIDSYKFMETNEKFLIKKKID